MDKGETALLVGGIVVVGLVGYAVINSINSNTQASYMAANQQAVAQSNNDPLSSVFAGITRGIAGWFSSSNSTPSGGTNGNPSNTATSTGGASSTGGPTRTFVGWGPDGYGTYSDGSRTLLTWNQYRLAGTAPPA